jgi:hypothetical protein
MKWIKAVVTVTTVLAGSLQASQQPCDPSSESPSEPVMESILVPVTAYALQGANGSLWDTELWASNTTDQPIVYFFGLCTISCCCVETNTFAPQETRLVGGDSPRGQWYELPADGSLQLQARFLDRTRSSYWAGVELPIIRERDFRNGDLQLVGVPRDPRFRVTVRVYGLAAGVVARVEQLDQSGLLLQQQDLPLEPPAETFGGTTPAYAQMSIPAAAVDSQPIRIRIRSLTVNQRLWAFASVTNNESGQVTLVSPWW